MARRLTDDDAEAVRKWLEGHQFEHVVSNRGDSSSSGVSLDAWEREGTLVRLRRDRGQWSCDLSRGGSVWLDLDRIARALGTEPVLPVERVSELATSMNDRMFGALSNTLPHTP